MASKSFDKILCNVGLHKFEHHVLYILLNVGNGYRKIHYRYRICKRCMLSQRREKQLIFNCWVSSHSQLPNEEYIRNKIKNKYLNNNKVEKRTKIINKILDE